MTIDSKALTRAAESMAEAVKHARLAYQFCPGSYTMRTLQAYLTAASALDQHISALAFAHSAEWLRKFPKIVEDWDGEEGKKETPRAAVPRRSEIHSTVPLCLG
jgi:hypothetical protein